MLGDPDLLTTYRAILSRWEAGRASLSEHDVADAVLFTQKSLGGQTHLAIALLEKVVARAPQSAVAWQCLGLARRDAQEMEGAVDALARAAALEPDNPTTAFARAQVLFETARPSFDAFRHARRLSPDNPTLIRNSAAAMSAEGMQDAAEALLGSVLDKEAEWLDGHKTWASLRAAAGRRFDKSLAYAIKARPQSLSLRLALVHLLSTARDWESASKVLSDAQKALGPSRGLELARLFIAAESGDPAGDALELFDPVSNVKDIGLDLCRVRHALRLGAPQRARDIAQSYIEGPHDRTFWPYLGLAWQVLGDDRADWLMGDPAHIASFDLGLSMAELSELAACLRGLHTLQARFLEQSVHGGTQTSGQLFFRSIPILQKVRASIQTCVQTYVDKLGNHDQSHPLLGARRIGPFLFEGSWSVLLRGGGYHSTHTHPKGWISSALYVDVPEIAARGTPPSGWISFGEAPPELGLNTAPHQQIEPKAGKLVLFPSTTWHRTMPFDQGERLTIAFDIRVPTQRLIS